MKEIALLRFSPFIKVMKKTVRFLQTYALSLLILISFSSVSRNLTNGEIISEIFPTVEDSIIMQHTNWTVGCFSCHNQTLNYIGMEGFTFSLTNESLHFKEDGGIWPNPYGYPEYTSVGAYTTFPTIDGNLVIVFDGRARANNIEAVLLGIRIYNPSNMTWLMSSASNPIGIPAIIGEYEWKQMIINITIPGYNELAVFWSYNDFFEADWKQEIWVENILVNPEPSEIPEPNFVPIIEGCEDIYVGIVGSFKYFYQFPRWTLYDDNPANYSLLINGIFYLWNVCSSGDTFIFDIYNELELEVGTYVLTFYVIDLDNNLAEDTVLFIVYKIKDDYTPPLIEGLDDMTILGEIFNFRVNWTLYDENPYKYEIYLDLELILTQNWTLGTEVEFIFETLTIGTYNITLVAFDLNMNHASDTVIILVQSSSHIISYPLFIAIMACILLLSIVSVKKYRKSI